MLGDMLAWTTTRAVFARYVFANDGMMCGIVCGHCCIDILAYVIVIAVLFGHGALRYRE